jgi:hypothetical protein
MFFFFGKTNVLRGYILNLSDFYSYRLIGKLTAFLQFQEFSLHNLPVVSSTSAARFSLNFKNRVGLALDKTTSLRITLNLVGVSIISTSHTHPSNSQTSRLLTSSLSLGIPGPRGTQCIRDM